MIDPMNYLFMNRFKFFYKFLQSPRNIGSVAPSSLFLTKKMMENIPWREIESIVELGAGTGVFSDYINRHKLPSTQTIIIEKDESMLEVLKSTYPSFHYGSDAEMLDEILKQLDLLEVDCIISGLPFANFSPELRNKIIRMVVHALKPGGIFIAFQYSLQMKKMLHSYFQEVDIRFVPLNIPPAFVYTCKKFRVKTLE